MIRVAFTLIGGRQWTGGYNYLLNLLHVLGDHASTNIKPILFLGEDLPEADLQPFFELSGVEIVRDSDFDVANRNLRLAQALVVGCDRIAVRQFQRQRVQLAFENAQFYGWRFPIAIIGWIPDFQHRRLRHLFGLAAYWKRDLGFRAQNWSNRLIMLSSEDARHDCEQFYPSTRGRTHVVHFAVPPPAIDPESARHVADSYGLPEEFFYLPNQFWKHKNHECVIRALSLLKQEGRSIVVAASGKQEDGRDLKHFPRLMQITNEMGIGNEFRVLGLIPYAHLNALMASCTALLNPSLFEGWSTTVEEAKSIGIPMALSDIRVHREQASENAVFFDPQSPRSLADALVTFGPPSAISRADCVTRAVEEAESRVRKFADDFCVLSERAVYEARK